MNLAGIWSTSLSLLESKLGMQVTDNWFRPIVLTGIHERAIHLEVPNRFFREWIEQRHLDELLAVLIQTTQVSQPDIHWAYSEKDQDPVRKRLESREETRKTRLATQGLYLNPKYTFPSFVVGSSNQFAHAATTAVADHPGKTYNPLFIYGGVGLGKTHLIHAAGNYLVDKRKTFRISYISAEEFTNDVIQSIRHDRMDDFRRRYRSLDVLLVDDIHFIAGKDRTQEEFFHIFNALYESEKQIIITSDRFPNEIPSITDRLRSRFSWGLIADIQAPDIETRIAILEKKADHHGIQLPRDVATYMANRIRSNVRELEGALVRLGAFASLTGKSITTDSVADVLRGLISDQDRPVTVELVQRAVSEYFGLKVSDLKSRKRTREVAFPRQVAMYLSKQHTDLSLADIGAGFGGKDHSTVIHACKQVRGRIDSDEDLARKIRVISERIKGERV